MNKLWIFGISLIILVIGAVSYFFSPLFFELRAKLDTSETQSVVHNPNQTTWKLTSDPIGKNENIERLYFYDENVIYGIRYGTFEFTIYRTEDAAKTWKKQATLNDYGVNDLFFISPTEGFMALSKLKPSSSPSENGSCIMKTEDGGLNWKVVYSSVNITLKKLRFNSDGLGLAVGRSDVSAPIADSKHLILFSKDRGQTWAETSDQLNALANSKGQINDFSTDVIFSKDKGGVVLSNKGKIYNTTDEGKSWKLISKPLGEPEQTGFGDFGEFDDGTFWTAGGTTSIEGKWAVISIMSKSSDEKYRLKGYYFSDVEFLSNDEVIAVGVKFPPPGVQESKKGVILHSINKGKDWTTIQESVSSSGFISINKLSFDKLFVTELEGNGVLLER